ncbi:hypothetical protein Mapa_003262 [Marchantia paleacea]|nr:hypothetical protein Mapa_003262 [Marchantia paleacea]
MNTHAHVLPVSRFYWRIFFLHSKFKALSHAYKFFQGLGTLIIFFSHSKQFLSSSLVISCLKHLRVSALRSPLCRTNSLRSSKSLPRSSFNLDHPAPEQVSEGCFAYLVRLSTRNFDWIFYRFLEWPVITMSLAMTILPLGSLPPKNVTQRIKCLITIPLSYSWKQRWCI